MAYLAKSTIRRAILGATFALTALALAPAALAHEYTVVINAMSYGATPDLKVGDTIVWVNRDTVLHSITARDHSFDLRLNPGQSVTQTMTKAGRFPFDCLFHGTMRGVLVVSDK